MFKLTLSLLNRLLPAEDAYAHCDIPCGIYDPIAAKIAAQTVLKMVMRIEALPRPGPSAPLQEQLAYQNTLARYVAVKEEHAQITKKELAILWADYFKPEHLQKHADLHTLFWNALKLASKDKQSVDKKAAQDLVDSVDQIARIFWETKGVSWTDTVAAARFGT